MKILIATDGSTPAIATEDFLIEITKPDSVAIDIVRAVPNPQYPTFGLEGYAINADLYHDLKQSAEETLKQTVQKFHEAHWEATSHLCQGIPGAQILDKTKLLTPDFVAVGAHGASRIEKFLLGSVSSKILRHAESSVLIHRGPAKPPGQKLKVLLAHDGSQDADQAVTFVKNYPWKHPLEVLVVHVIELVEAFNIDAIQHTSSGWESEVAATKEAIEAVQAELSSDHINVEGEVYQDENVAAELLRISEVSKSDMVVLGHQGRGAVSQFLLGSVAYRVAEHAACSVLVVR